MRIVHFVHRMYPDIGGVELSVERIAAEMSHAGHDVTIVTETPDASVRDAEDVRIRHLSVRPVRPFTRARYWSWMSAHRDEFARADVLHFHDYGTFVHWYLPLYAVLRSPVYAMTFHGFDSWPVRRRDDVQRAFSARRMDVTFGAGDFLRMHYSQRIDHTYVGAPLRRRTNGVWQAQPAFLFIGRLAPDTCIAEVAAELAAAAAATRRNASLTLVGDGVLENELLGLKNEWFDVIHTPATPDVSGFLETAGVMIGTGFLSVLDAFAYDVPVIAPALTPIKRDYFHSLPDVEHNLLYCESRTALRSTFESLLHGDGFHRASSAALSARCLADSLTWEGIADLYLKNYAKRRHR